MRRDRCAAGRTGRDRNKSGSALAGIAAVARHAERDEAEIGELRRRAVLAARADVAVRAVALGGIVEQREAARLLRPSARPCRPDRRRTCCCTDRTSRSPARRPRAPAAIAAEGRVGVVEHVVAEDRAQRRRRSRRARTSATTAAGVCVGHLERREQRQARLVAAAIGARRPRSGRRSGPCRRCRRLRPPTRRSAR